MNEQLLNEITSEYLQEGRDTFKVGDGVKVHVRVREGESYLDSNATSSMIRIKLANLDEYIVQVKHDIGKFNNYVKVLVETLRARGETTSDLITNLSTITGTRSC